MKRGARGTKTRVGEPEDEDEESTSSWESWPAALSSGRPLFVAGLSVRDARLLTRKGYHVIDVLALPRGNDPEHQYAIEGWLQGMSEGSIPMDKERRLSLELEARARGLLVQRSMKVDVSVKATPKTLEDLLAARDSRFTLNRASTSAIERAVLAAVTPNLKNDEEEGN